MFDIDSGKLLIVAVLALIVIGPKELPRVLRQVGQAVGKLRRMAGEFQGQFMDAMKEADIADIRKDLDDLKKSAALDVHFDPARDIRTELTSVMQPTAVVAESTTPSPAANFELPPASESNALGSVGAGIAPASESEPALEPVVEGEGAVAHMNGSSAHVDVIAAPKRKILVKRRTSRQNIVQPDAVAQRTGEPLLVRRRIVRAKAASSDLVSTS